MSFSPPVSATPTVQPLRQRLTSACVILLVAAVSLDHRPIPRLADTAVAVAGTALAAGLALRAAPRTRVLYLAGALFGVAVALSSLPIRGDLPIVGSGRAFYLPALVLVAIAGVLAWPELRAALSQDREKIRTAAVENSRAHTSRELHDETLQALIHLRRSLEHAAADPDVDELRQAAKDGAALAAEQIIALRDIIADLHPSLLTDLGLDAALETLADRIARRHPELSVEYRSEPPGSSETVDTATALAMYRIAQEALTNAVKHSGATHIVLSFTQHGTDLTLQVTDNGTGLTQPTGSTPPRRAARPRDAGDSGGIGIAALHARAALHDGHITIDSPASDRPGTPGTIVTAHLRSDPHRVVRESTAV
ncbi:sensor histidine kinase [Cryptosporangium phraense]|uniref:histidine kinase n=1 Tax=Cryptosporangium phraense TaxID=2593070 RepID=A0A545AND7_9ACTN|nr:sensor histidine kinase [Cryptosporangium phraense]TQS42780.1 hypothetical protein FL583_22210 [Cryptosporangium phraense]